MPRFVLSLPPNQNHGYVLGQGHIYKSAALRAWEDEAALVVGQWTPPKHIPLVVTIALLVPRPLLRKVDADGMVKFVVDAVVGKRRDAWVDQIGVWKTATDGEPQCQVNVEPLPTQEECKERASDV